MEDKLDYDYDSPPSWHYPVRQTLGAVLIAANHTVDAETVYRKDLKLFPENGRSLAKSLKAQGKTQEAQVVQKRFATAWKMPTSP